MGVKEKIISSAASLLFRLGARSVTTDDISREAGISKKTLYKEFSDKEEIIISVCKTTLSLNLQMMEEIAKKSKDPVHEIILTGNHISRIFGTINPVLLFELKRYYPEAWKLLDHFKKKHVMKILENNLKKGIEMGIYRPELNVSLMAHFRLAQFDLALEPDIFPIENVSLGEIQLSLLHHFLHGITTIKGHKLLDKYKRLNDEKKLN
ncbi:MAG: TetR/AcrR family transcriptional regulator [Bacteroidota bacterium]|jgi:AcrR family transcriptional regulator